MGEVVGHQEMILGIMVLAKAPGSRPAIIVPMVEKASHQEVMVVEAVVAEVEPPVLTPVAQTQAKKAGEVGEVPSS